MGLDELIEKYKYKKLSMVGWYSLASNEITIEGGDLMADRSIERFKEIEAEPLGCKSVSDNIVCIGCMFAYGDTPMDDTPYKSYCAIYSRENGKQKPKSIYFDGEPCKYRRTKQHR